MTGIDSDSTPRVASNAATNLRVSRRSKHIWRSQGICPQDDQEAAGWGYSPGRARAPSI